MNTSFPGRWIGGVTLVLGPVVFCAGFLLRYLGTTTALTPEQVVWAEKQPFAAYGEFVAYVSDPALLTLAYAVFALGALLLFPAFVALGQMVGGGLAYWGATLLVVGLFARLYFAGADQTAFQLTEALGLDQARSAVMKEYVDISYGPWRVPVWASVGQYAGSVLLAIAAWRTGLFGTARAVMVVLAGGVWMGVLKGASPGDVVVVTMLCVALVPLGVGMLRDRLPVQTGRSKVLSW
ncbi:hypothetical protein SAMN05444920_102511 [Nonomuraea solani]|uniref:Uncharacterized protein n=1 Tax=Nonomuraea solani TaxID=1144553 RepID=A0A1H5Z4U9_9ACTN|nr:hypothetical protein [Nonomuraea solani]SEG30386.1 hypothetical protein SAMN05444920_102511 [Nonomuraea solani]